MLYDHHILEQVRESNGSYLIDPIENLELLAIKDFLPRDSCDKLISIARANSSPSVHLDLSTGNASEQREQRNSTTHVLHPSHPECFELVKAMARLIGSTVSNAEPVNLIRYETGGFFKEHLDAYSPIHTLIAEYGSSNRLTDLLSAGNRTWTLMVYLNDDYTGGTTLFPRLSIGFTANRGSIVGWKNSINSKPIVNSLHAGDKVLSGEKFVAVVPFRERNCNQDDSSYYIQ